MSVYSSTQTGTASTATANLPTINVSQVDSFSGDSLEVQVEGVYVWLMQKAMKANRLNINFHRICIQKSYEEQSTKLDKYFKDSAGAASLKRKFGWLGKILAPVITAIIGFFFLASTAVTCGAAAPTLASLPSIAAGLSALFMTVGQIISEECHGPSLSPADQIVAACTKFLVEVCHMSDEAAAKFAPILAVLTLIIVGAVVLPLAPAALVTLADPKLYGHVAEAMALICTASEEQAAIVNMVFTMVAMFVEAAVCMRMMGPKAANVEPGKLKKAVNTALAGSIFTGGAVDIAQGSGQIQVATATYNVKNDQTGLRVTDELRQWHQRWLNRMMQDAKDDFSYFLQGRKRHIDYIENKRQIVWAMGPSRG